jgi:hypothetical protein
VLQKRACGTRVALRASINRLDANEKPRGRATTYKVHANGGDVALCVRVVGESKEEARFPDTRIADEQVLVEVIAARKAKGEPNRAERWSERSQRTLHARRLRHREGFSLARGRTRLEVPRAGRTYYSGFMVAREGLRGSRRGRQGRKRKATTLWKCERRIDVARKVRVASERRCDVCASKQSARIRAE